jgi:tetratricopeptide (TPR) repeat protein/predicted Ser/Thr protein kinase
MTPEQWARVKELFHAALAEEASRRRAFVAEQSAGDVVVRAEVERLLDADLSSSQFLESPAVDALLTGQVIGHFEVGRLLGRGGMGHVYAARDLKLGRQVALKIASAQSEDAQARLRREGRHASRLSHPHICHIHDVGRADDGRVFVVMELVQGRPLADLTREGPLAAALARRYGLEIADALAHAHEQGVTHRDLKSTNVLITPARGAKVLDFGLARMLDSHQIDALSHSQHSLIAEGVMAGTLACMPPEVLRGQRGDQRADIWALGVLLYEMVSGRRPFSGATGFEVSAAILHQPPAPLPADVPAAMRAIVERCLEKDPATRYQHAADVHRALDDMKLDRTPVGGSDANAALGGDVKADVGANAQAASSRDVRAAVGRDVAAAFGRSARDLRTALRQHPIRALVALLLVAVITAIFYGIESGGFRNVSGYSSLHSGEFDDAVAEFVAVTQQQPEKANAWDSLGEGYVASGLPDKALDAYARALLLDPAFEAPLFGRGLALAALGRYDAALQTPAPDFRIQAFLLSRVGRYREAAAILEDARQDASAENDADLTAHALLTSSWLLIEQQQYVRAFDEIDAAEKALGAEDDSKSDPLLVLAGLLAGVAEIRSGSVDDAIARAASQKTRADEDDRVEANWIAALDGEIALAQRRYPAAVSAFNDANRPAWLALGLAPYTVFAANPPSRDGRARVEIARGNRAAAIEEYRRLTSPPPPTGRPGVLEPRHVLALARLLEQHGDAAGARAEYELFLELWAKADPGLPETREARDALARLPAKP